MDKDGNMYTPKTLTTLMDLAKSGKLSHALIIECNDIEAAYSFCMDIAKAALCTGDDKPCGKCGNCIKVKSNSHPDIKTIGADEKNKSIKIDEIRKIRECAYIVSNEGAGKFYIIKNAEYMTVQAQNALIKILEEPPKDVTFVLICKSPENLLSTIRSRAHIFKVDFGSLNSESDILSLASKIAKASMNSENDKILEYIAGFGNDRKAIKKLIEMTAECLIGYFKEEKISDNLANDLILKIDKLKNFANLIDKNVNINLLMCAVCSCL